MTRNSHQRRTLPNVTLSLAALTLFAATSVLLVFSPVTAFGQGMPPRGNTLMRTKPLTKPPLTDTQRLRRDIVDATTPYGLVNARQLIQSAPSLRPWIGIDQYSVSTQYTAQSLRPTVPIRSTVRTRMVPRAPSLRTDVPVTPSLRPTVPIRTTVPVTTVPQAPSLRR